MIMDSFTYLLDTNILSDLVRHLTNQLEVVLSGLDVLPLEQPTDDRYAELRTALEQAGTTIGSNDMFIAAHALALGLILVTANVNEFSRVPGLAVENWLV